MLVAFRCSSSARFTVPRSASALTAISSSCTTSATSAMSWLAVPSAGTTTPVTILGPNPIMRTRIDTGPAGTPVSVYRPSSADTVRMGPPTSSTCAPATGAPFSASTTRPITRPVPWACSTVLPPAIIAMQDRNAEQTRTVVLGIGSGGGGGHASLDRRPADRTGVKVTDPGFGVDTEVQRECHDRSCRGPSDQPVTSRRAAVDLAGLRCGSGSRGPIRRPVGGAGYLSVTRLTDFP